MKKRSQGEIFGLALMFVVIIIGIIVYAKIKAINGVDETNTKIEGEYKILAEGTLNTILKVSTECYVERNKDSVKDLINFCLANEYSGIDAEITCNGVSRQSCDYAKEILNNTVYKLFNSSEGIGNIPFELKIDIPANEETLLSNVTFTNFNDFEYKGQTINQSNRRKFRYKRAPSGLITWPTAHRAIEFELYLYYR